MSNKVYVYMSERFEKDLRAFCEVHSFRKIASQTHGELTSSKVYRIATGQTKPRTNELALLCSIIGSSPADYYDRVLF